MKVILFDTTCAFLTPGGKTTHAVKLQKEISKLGVDIEFSRWWDSSLRNADIIHFLSPVPSIAKLAKERGMGTYLSMIFDYETSKPLITKVKSIAKARVLSHLPFGLSRKFGYWNALPYMDKIQFMHMQDRDTALKFFPGFIDRKKTIIIPHAYDPEEMFLDKGIDIGQMGFPAKYLVSCANIAPRKQNILLARLAKKARIPVVFMGSSLDNDPYFKAFKSEVDGKYVFYPGYVSREMRDCIERNASGYVLLSRGESGCIAVYEAAAYKMPILLSNLPWAKGYDNPTDVYFCDFWNEAVATIQLKEFYENSGKLDHMPFNAMTWSEVAKLYVAEYEKICNA